MHEKRGRRRAAGFTLIELLVVLVILGIIAGIAVGQFAGTDEKAKWDSAKVEIASIDSAVMRFKLDMGRYPTQDEGLRALIEEPGGEDAEKWNGPYIKNNDIKDPWGREYVYRNPGTGNARYDIVSYGADGQEGGEKWDKDISNHD